MDRISGFGPLDRGSIPRRPILFLFKYAPYQKISFYYLFSLKYQRQRL